MKAKKQTISIRITGEPNRDIEAMVIGPFAYHPTQTASGASEHFFAVTHVSSGYCVTQSCPSPQRAAQCIRDIIAAAPMWDHIPVDTASPEYWKAIAAAGPVIKEYRMRGWA
jgi:hypothetical protein